MPSLLSRLESIEKQAGDMFHGDGPLGDLLRRGGQGRLPGETERIVCEHVHWLLGREMPAEVSNAHVDEFCERLTRRR